jgi:hypothetical protein
MTLQRLFAPLLVAAALLASGCASVPMGDPQQDKAVKTFSVKPGKAGIYVYRNENFGGAVTMDVFLNDRPLGQTAAKTFLFAEVEPGVHKVLGKAENESIMNVIAEAGRNYFVWQEVKMGIFFARNELKIVDEKTGQEGVLECSLAATPK